MHKRANLKGRETAERIDVCDYMKAFLIFCVVLGHITYWFPDENDLLHCTKLWIYFFHMPAFIFLAGLFSKNTVNEKKWEKVVPYILLYLLMKTVNYFVDIYRGLDGAEINFFKADGVEWFALAMFWWYVITILVKEVHPCYVIIASVCMSMLSGYMNTDGSFMVWQRTVTFYPFFWLGYKMEVDRIAKQSQVHRKVKIVFSAALFILLFLVIYFYSVDRSFWLKLLRGCFSYQDAFGSANSMFMLGGIYRLLISIVSCALIFALITVFLVFSGRKNNVISYIGRRTLPIFAFHSPMIPLLFYLSSGQLKTFMLETNLFVASIVFGVFLVVFTSLSCFVNLVNKIMVVPMNTHK